MMPVFSQEVTDPLAVKASEPSGHLLRGARALRMTTLAGLALILLTVACGPRERERPAATTPGAPRAAAPTEPQFKPEGRLAFLSGRSGDTLSRIDIEVADTEGERTQGLMYRSRISEGTGMLFIFDEVEDQSFWMKNTPSSLDIIFLSPEGRILNIHAYTTPYSTQSYPSAGPSDKVVEVRGGYCQQYGIGPGDRVVYELERGPAGV